MQDKAIVIISNMVDATIRGYQPDTDFFIFKTIDGLADYISTTPIRAQNLFFTRDVCGRTNQAFSFLYDLLTDNSYIHVDNVIYITEKDSQELQSVYYLIDEKGIDNWEIIEGSLTKAYITEVINGTARQDTFSAKQMAVYRQPRSEYVRAKIQEYSSLDESYADDEIDLSNIPDEHVPEMQLPPKEDILEKVYIIGEANDERTAFTFLAAQYLSQTGKTIIIESDNEYHKLTEFYTKSGITATEVSITALYDDPASALNMIKATTNNLVVITCIDRYEFNYDFITALLFYNLMSDFRYMMIERKYEEFPENIGVTVVVPDTVIGCLTAGQNIDQSQLKFINFVGVDLNALPEVHVPSSQVNSKILQDVLSDTSIQCPIVRISSLRLDGTIYDLGSVLYKNVIRK